MLYAIGTLTSEGIAASDFYALTGTNGVMLYRERPRPHGRNVHAVNVSATSCLLLQDGTLFYPAPISLAMIIK